MPYSGPADPGLPANVKKMPEKKRRQWVAIFNATMKRCQQGKLPPAPGGGGGDCESRAFAIANGTVKEAGKEVGLLMEIEGEALELKEETGDDKCDDMPMAAPAPYGGATSFEEVRDHIANRDVQYAVEDLWGAFNAILRNVQDDPELDGPQKVTKVQAAAAELADLMRAPEESAEEMGFKEKVAAIVGRLLGRPASPPKLDIRDSAFFSFKDKTGAWRWLAVHSNKFRDEDGDIFPEAAHLSFVARADVNKEYPELWLWHTPGSRVGSCDLLDYVDGFMLSSGPFDEGMELAAAALHDSEDDLGVSHGYRYPVEAKRNGVISEYDTFEVSPLPRTKEANVWTSFAAVAGKEAAMPLSTEKRKFLADVLGEEKVDAIEEGLAAFSKDLEAHGVAWKEVKAVLDSEETNGSDPKDPKDEPAAPADPAAPTDPAAEPAADPAVGDADPEEETQSVDARLTRLEEGQGKIATAVTEMVDAVKALQVTDDEKLADLISPRRPAPGQDTRPSDDPNNVIDEKTAAELVGETDDPPENPISAYVRQLTGAGVNRS